MTSTKIETSMLHLHHSTDSVLFIDPEARAPSTIRPALVRHQQLTLRHADSIERDGIGGDE
jgi:hypothetical protein